MSSLRQISQIKSESEKEKLKIRNYYLSIENNRRKIACLDLREKFFLIVLNQGYRIV